MKRSQSTTVKTVLEYMVMLNEQSYSGIGRQLNITPQQFSDWIKKRRPIPQERLQALAAYFGVGEEVLVDTGYFASPLTPLAKVQLHMLLLDQKIAQLEGEGAEEEDIAAYRDKKLQLEREREHEIRLGRVAEALQRDHDGRLALLLDQVLDEAAAKKTEGVES
ncbi:helix-turn-helix transcriptional regulator [Paenibacillus sp. F411]|uniref:helix-turn-helix domain-containing protein n=1 Tax=Paenibacillus sp. F411 TaxID=2820239 RepID=UPI001AAE2D73|nr:helix-turn-helix transcriptional regulator [Paenibacillus sp. F411]MBO2944434.1 helix-turn-helix transcriptional regulator [Paenibacillus sp. F411]